MISIETLRTLLEYVRKYAQLDFETMQLVASQLSEITFPHKHIILPEGGVCMMQMFSNYYIASYIGIAPQSLSRIRTQH